MFGYLKPDLPYLYLKDDKLFKGLYCAVCKSIGANCSTMSRMTLTYDMAFLSAFCHNVMGVDVELKNEHCCIHPITKRPIATRTDISAKTACINVLLAKYKIEDDVIDKTGSKLKRLVVSGGYKKARAKYKEIDEIISDGYNRLRKLEAENESSIDKVCEPFSKMMSDIAREVLQDKFDDNVGQLFYFLGKWVYLIDALDDYDKDIKNKNYNPFYASFGFSSAIELLNNRAIDVDFIFNDIFFNLRETLKNVKFSYNCDLIANIVLRGIPQKTQNVIKGIINGKQNKRNIRAE